MVLDGFGMVLPTLKLLKRAHVRVAVVEIGNQTDVELVMLGVVHECSAT